MNRKECRDTRREIDELEIDQQPSGTALAHLAVCATCCQFRNERAELRELVSSLEPVAAPADFDMRLRARIAAQRQAERRQPFFARLIGTPALATAAAMVLFVGAVVWVSQRNNERSTPVARKESPAKTATTSNSAAVQPNASQPDIQESSELVAVSPVNSPARPRTLLRPAGYTRDMNVRGAGDPIRQSEANQAFVNAPSKPVEVSVEDQSGKKRKISLPPVSFGAQTLVDNRVPVSYAGNSRVW